MKKRKTKPKKEKAPAPEPKETPEVVPAPEPEAPVKEAAPGCGKDLLKGFAIIVLLAIAAFLIFKFFLSGAMFVPGSEVDSETFKDIFASADKVYIFMDVRGVQDSHVSTNILQCGVDFAGSSGMGGKEVTYFSLADDGCIALDGPHPASYCFEQLKNGITIYVKEGPDGAKYYTNGMVVTVGSYYELGTCGIHRV